MSHEPDAEKRTPPSSTSSEVSSSSRPLLLADYGATGLLEVELLDHPVAAEERQVEALVADSQCEV